MRRYSRTKHHSAISHNAIGLLLQETGKLAEALKAYEAALAIQQKLADPKEHKKIVDAVLANPETRREIEAQLNINPASSMIDIEAEIKRRLEAAGIEKER